MGFFTSKTKNTEAATSGSSVSSIKQSEAGVNVPFDHTSTDIAAIMANPNLDDSPVPRVTVRTGVMAIIAAMGG